MDYKRFKCFCKHSLWSLTRWFWKNLFFVLLLNFYFLYCVEIVKELLFPLRLILRLAFVELVEYLLNRYRDFFYLILWAHFQKLLFHLVNYFCVVEYMIYQLNNCVTKNVLVELVKLSEFTLVLDYWRHSTLWFSIDLLFRAMGSKPFNRISWYRIDLCHFMWHRSLVSLIKTCFWELHNV